MTGIHRLSLLAGFGLLGCGGEPASGGTLPGPSTSGGGGQANSAAGTTGTTGGTGNSQAGATTTGGTAGGTTTTAGTSAGGTATAGSAGSAGSGGTSPVEDPVAHPLDITAAAAEHLHTISGRPAGVDTRVTKILGKLIVNVDVDDGDAYDYGLKHGYHVYGAKMFHCDIAESTGDYAEKGRDFNGNCRLETFDGVDHDPSANVAPADSIMGKVKQALTDLAAQYPEEGWPYFLSADGNVRWSDVGITGYSHGATSAARWAKKQKIWRVVSRSGPRDNICGSAYKGQACPDSAVSSWLDETSLTPMDRYFALVGNQDSQYGDFVFGMERMKYVGALTDVTAGAPAAPGAHRLFINGAHDAFTDKKYWPVLDYVWGTPAENVTYANTH